MTFLLLFLEFFKTGLFAIGGGLATLPFLKQISLRYPWFTPNDLMDMIAVSESTPGPMGVNSATYAGFHAAGIPGALMATCSLVLPSVICRSPRKLLWLSCTLLRLQWTLPPSAYRFTVATVTSVSTRWSA